MIDLHEEKWLRWLAEHDPFSAAYLGCDSESHALRLAHALRAHWTGLPARIEPGDRLVGRLEPRGVGGYSYGVGITVDAEAAAALQRLYPEWGAHLDTLVDFWRSWSPQSRMHLPADEELLNGQRVYWAGGWGGHAILDFTVLLAVGTEGIRCEIEHYLETDPDRDRALFRQALLVVCEGMEAFAANYARRAREITAGETDAACRQELLAIAERCERVPRQGARTFAEALQSFWFLHLLDGCDSPGRFDQYLLPYYQRDVDAGQLSPEDAQQWLDHLWKRFNDTRSWNLCLGGLLPDGSDGTNPLTYMALEATRRIRQAAPNLSLRLHRNSPPELWRAALAVIATGVGMPAIYNDDCIIPALCRYDIPEDEARDYALNGCSQIDIQGRSHMGLEDGELDLLKCLELALHDGVDPVIGQQLGPRTGDPRSFTCFEQLWAAYTAQVEYCAGRMIAAANAYQQALAETAPALLRSLFTSDCIARGRDFKAGGPRYNHGQILTQGIANTADALAAVQRLVFEEGSLPMAALLDALEHDFPDESLRQRLLHGAPKFGNDEEAADRLAARIIEHFFSHLNTYRTWRGGVYGGGSIVFVRAPLFGSHVGATPDGRSARGILADSVGPAQGRDHNGPTALLRSVAGVPQGLAQSSYVLNLKLTPRVVQEKPDAVIALLQGYFRDGGQQVQINVVDRETLEQARAHPEDHTGLVVRVGGYSDYFVRLTPELQADVIARTEHAC